MHFNVLNVDKNDVKGCLVFCNFACENQICSALVAMSGVIFSCLTVPLTQNHTVCMTAVLSKQPEHILEGFISLSLGI